MSIIKTMTKKNIASVILLSALILGTPILVFAQQKTSCGEASTTFSYPEKIIFNQSNGRFYVFSETGLLTVLNEGDLSVVKKFKAAEGFPKDFALNSKTNLLYILDNRPAKIRIYDANTLESKGVIDITSDVITGLVQTELFQINIDENANKLYVLDRLGSRFLVIDVSKNAVEKEYKIAYAAAFWNNYKTQKVYFRSQGIGGIQELDLKSGKTFNILTGPLPQDLAIDTINNRVLVVDSQGRNLTAIDAATRKVFKTVDLRLIGAPRFVAISERLNMAVATCYTNNAAFYNLKTLDLVKHVVLPENSQPERTFFDEERKLAYIPNQITSVISVIDLNTFQILRNVKSGVLHDSVFYSHNFLQKEGVITPNGNFYLTYPYSQNISRLTPDGQMTFIGGFSKDDPLLNNCPADNPVFAFPNFMTFNADESKLYVANRGRFVTVLDTKEDKPLRKIDLNLSATNTAYNQKTDRIFVSHITNNKVSVIDAKTDKLIDQVQTGIRPRQLIANTQNGDMYVLTVLSNAITVIHPNLSVSEIKLDSEPINGKYDAATNRLFVTTFNSAFVIDGKSNQVLKLLPELRNNGVAIAAGKIVFTDMFRNYFSVVDPQSLEIQKVSFNNPFFVTYYEPAKKVYVIDLYDTKIVVFDVNFKVLTTIDSQNVARNFGTTFLAASDKYIYRLDDPNSVIQVIDPKTDTVLKDIKLISGKTASGGFFTSTISAFAVDRKDEKLYISNAPLPQITVLYLADINQYATKIITGSFRAPYTELLKQYWWAILIALAAIGLVIYYLIKKVKEAAVPPIAPTPKV